MVSVEGTCAAWYKYGSRVFHFEYLLNVLLALTLSAHLQVAHARLATIPSDQALQRVVFDLQVGGSCRLPSISHFARSLPRLQTRRLPRLLVQIIPGNFQLLFIVVPTHSNDFHSIQQRLRYRTDVIRRADEQRLREVHRHVNVVVDERRVLIRVQHLQQRTRRVSLHVTAQQSGDRMRRRDLVHLVDQNQRVVHLRRLQTMDQLARH